MDQHPWQQLIYVPPHPTPIRRSEFLLEDEKTCVERLMAENAMVRSRITLDGQSRDYPRNMVYDPRRFSSGRAARQRATGTAVLPPDARPRSAFGES